MMNHVEGGGNEYVLRANASPRGHMNYQGMNAKMSPRIGGGNRVGDNSAYHNSNEETAYPTNTNHGAPGLLPNIHQRNIPP